MAINTKLSKILLLAALLAESSYRLLGCAQAEEKPETNGELRGMGMVVQFGLANGASPKEGVSVVSDAGNNLYSSDLYKEGVRHQLAFGAGTNMSFPRWVHVTWRKGPGIDYDFKNGRFFGGTVIGDYKVQVLNRIPLKVFKYVIGAGNRVIVLRFRIKDDGVLFAWDIQETVNHPKGGRNLVFSMHGGDFPCETSPYQPQPDCTEGRLEDAPWYNPLWTRN
jgi:hypothetical protein